VRPFSFFLQAFHSSCRILGSILADVPIQNGPLTLLSQHEIQVQSQAGIDHMKNPAMCREYKCGLPRHKSPYCCLDAMTHNQIDALLVLHAVHQHPTHEECDKLDMLGDQMQMLLSHKTYKSHASKTAQTSVWHCSSSYICSR